MSLGRVVVWQMTEEERLAYIAKHPIVPTEKPKGTSLTDISEMQFKKAAENRAQKKVPRIIDSVDKDKLHKLFMSGMLIGKIAKELNVSESNLNSYIKEQRKMDPEKWPYRAKRK